MERARLNQDTLAGVLFVACGALGLWLSRDLAAGSAAAMGPGFMPRVLCWCMIGLGAAIAFKGVVKGQRLEAWKVRPLFFVLASILAFYLLLPTAGLFIAACVTVIVCAIASNEFHVHEVALLALCLAVASVVALVFGLGLQMSAWPV